MKCLKKILLLCLSACVLSLSCLSSSASAAGIYTNAFRIQGYNNVSHDVQQLYPIYYGPAHSFSVGTPISGATWNWVSEYDWITPFIDIEGNTAAFHWETNIVAQSTNTSFQNPFNNLDSLYVSRCGSRTVNQQSVSYAITPWSEGNYKKYTLTVYADVSLTGFNKGTQDDVRCAIASYDDSFIDTDTSAISSYQVYFEKNIINYVFSDSIDNSLLQTMIGQNTTLIQQNQETRETIDRNAQEIVDATEELNDSVTDSTVTGDFNITTIEAFGPLGTIVNNLIAFVGDLLTIGSTSCQPLKPPLPQYAGGGTLDISCPSSFMQPYKQFTDAIDVIIAAYLWFKIAVYIYHSVENLRNPENDDEEFLEL